MDEPTRESPALSALPQDLQMEYGFLLARLKEDVSPIEGLTSLHDMVLERFTFLYVALRALERDWANLDQQRYNQLLSTWLKVSSDLINQYQEIYSKGALNQVFTEKVMTIVVEEVKDPDCIARIHKRLVTAEREAKTI